LILLNPPKRNVPTNGNIGTHAYRFCLLFSDD
jgi:hypothetical protein